jgi:hypothetical protein
MRSRSMVLAPPKTSGYLVTTFIKNGNGFEKVCLHFLFYGLSLLIILFTITRKSLKASRLIRGANTCFGLSGYEQTRV